MRTRILGAAKTLVAPVLWLLLAVFGAVSTSMLLLAVVLAGILRLCWRPQALKTVTAAVQAQKDGHTQAALLSAQRATAAAPGFDLEAQLGRATAVPASAVAQGFHIFPEPEKGKPGLALYCTLHSTPMAIGQVGSDAHLHAACATLAGTWGRLLAAMHKLLFVLQTTCCTLYSSRGSICWLLCRA
jgi:hypothetical protein